MLHHFPAHSTNTFPLLSSCIRRASQIDLTRLLILQRVKIRNADDVFAVCDASVCQWTVLEKGRLAYFYDAKRMVSDAFGDRLVTEEEAFENWPAYMRTATPLEVSSSCAHQLYSLLSCSLTC